MEDISGDLYAKYTDDIQKLESGMITLSESFIYNEMSDSTLKFSKAKTNEIENIDISLLHLISSLASDSSLSVLQLM